MEFVIDLQSSQPYEIEEVNVTITDEADRIRAETGLKLQDAIIAVTAVVRKVKRVVIESFRKASKAIGIRTPKEVITESDLRKSLREKRYFCLGESILGMIG